ncbi:hypothetical protein BS17DRAFT_786457 [Gyrodon lividus]|nr:hypothetical protein BS17DRAFT_786457 [Gyrodon lividus]
MPSIAISLAGVLTYVSLLCRQRISHTFYHHRPLQSETHSESVFCISTAADGLAASLTLENPRLLRGPFAVDKNDMVVMYARDEVRLCSYISYLPSQSRKSNRDRKEFRVWTGPREKGPDWVCSKRVE